MGQIETEIVLKTSVLGTLRIFVVMLAGFLASKLPRSEPLLTKETCRTSSRLCALLFLPSLVVSSIGSTLTTSILLDSWQLVFAAGFTILISFATAGVVGRVFLSPQDRRRLLPVQLAIAFPSPLAFPLLLVDVLCQQDVINSDFDGDTEYCFTRGTGMIFILFIVWQILFYGWGFPTLGQDSNLELKLAGPSDSLGASTATVHRLTCTEETNASGRVAIDIKNSNDALMSASGIPERDGPDKERNSNHEYFPVSIDQATASRAAEDAREPYNCSQGQPVLSTIAMTCTADEQGMRTENISMEQTGTSTVVEDDMRVGYRMVIEHRARKLLQSPNILAVVLGIVISLIPSLQDMLFNNTKAALWPLGAALKTLGTPEVTLSTVIMAGSLLQVSEVTVAANREQTWSQFRVVAGAIHVGCRLIVVPAAGFSLFWLANTQSTIMGSNRLMHVIILIQFAMPSTSLIIVSLNQLKMPATAGFMAKMFVVQYGISMLTVSAWTALALRIVY